MLFTTNIMIRLFLINQEGLVCIRSTILVCSLIIFDQISKSSILSFFSENSLNELTILPFLDLILVCNQEVGLNFSSLTTRAGLLPFIFQSFVICLLVISKTRLPSFTSLSPNLFSCLVGGLLSNSFDRIHYEFVIDFLDFHWNGNHLPSFNLADILISSGILLIFLIYLKNLVKKYRV